MAKKIKAKVFEFQIQKIEDVKSLSNLIRLSFDEPTLVVSQNIHQATEEALNAFLKNLEEPQENIYFAFTSPSVSKVLPTIVSRCQVVMVNQKSEKMDESELEKFLGSSTAQKLEFIDKIKDRNEAIELTERLINFMHSSLHENRVKYSQLAEKIMIVQETYTCLKANGNVNLHLSKMAINL